MTGAAKARLPLFFLFSLLFFFLAPLFLVFGFSAPATPIPVSTFREDRAEIESALAEAKKAYPLRAEENPGAARQEILFYEGALRYSLPVWSGDFYFEGAALWATIQQEWEILNANQTEENTPRRRYLEEQDRLLSEILETKNAAAFPAFYESFYLGEEGAEPERIRREAAELSLRISATEDGALAPWESYYISLILDLDKSLAEGSNAFDPAKEGSPLSQRDKLRLEALREYYRSQIESGGQNRVVANTETVFFGEELFTFFLFPAALVSLWEKKRRDPEEKILPSLLSFSLLFSLAASAGITLSAQLFVPHSVERFPVFFFSRLIPLPFSLGVLFRMLLRLLSLVPVLFLFELFTEKGKSVKKQGLMFSLGLFLYQGASLLCRVFLSPLVNLFLPFGYLDLKGALLPTYPLSLATPPSAAAFTGYLLLLSLLLLWRKRRKRA